MEIGHKNPLRKPRLPEGFCVGRMKKRKAESGKRERRGDPCGRPEAGRTDCHGQCAHWSRNDGLFARGTMERRDTWAPPYTALFCRGGRPCPPGSVRSLWCVGEELSCPPPPLRMMGVFYRCWGVLGSGCGPDRVKMAPFKAISGVPSVERICRVRVS